MLAFIDVMPLFLMEAPLGVLFLCFFYQNGQKGLQSLVLCDKEKIINYHYVKLLNIYFYGKNIR